MVRDLPVRLMLTIVGAEEGEHVFFVHVEEKSDTVALVGGEDVVMPYLRAGCVCGWEAEDGDRFTLEENAHWLWLKHARGEA